MLDPDHGRSSPRHPLQVGAQTETELKEKKLRVEDALNATKAAVEEGIVTGGGCTLLRLSNMVDEFKANLTDDEQKVGCGCAGSTFAEVPCRRLSCSTACRQPTGMPLEQGGGLAPGTRPGFHSMSRSTKLSGHCRLAPTL